MIVKCPNCGESNIVDLVGKVVVPCVGCGTDFEAIVADVPAEPQTKESKTEAKAAASVKYVEPSEGVEDGLPVPCKICDRGELRLVKLFWLPKPLVILGYLVASPAVLYIVGAVFWLIVGATGVATAESAADAASGALVTTYVVSALIIPALVFLLIGAIFVAKKRFLKCSNCKVVHSAD